MLASLQLALDKRKAEGLLRQRRLLDSPQADILLPITNRIYHFAVMII